VHPEVVIVPFVFAVPAAVITLFRWFRHKEKMASLAASPTHTHEMQERLQRVEQSVDAIAVEMERIGEGQRFVTRLLSERARADGVSLPRERVITPH
jgi:CRP-like cAMP-binding protein